MRHLRARDFLVLFAAIWLAACIAPTAAFADHVVQAGEGITFTQMDQTFSGYTQYDSDWAWMDVDLGALSAASGMSSGFLNVWQVGHGWSVQNILVDAGAGYSSVSAHLGLPVASGTDVSSLEAYISYSSSPITTFTTGTADTFAVGADEYNAEGEGAPSTGGLGPAPTASALSFTSGTWDAFWDTGVGNVETALNQCGPAAAANSLHWISHKYPWVELPHALEPGVSGVPTSSLPGQLDSTFGRPVDTGIGGNDMVSGILKYLQDNDLSDDVYVKFAGGFSSTVTVGAQSVPRASSSVTTGWIESEVKDGEDVEFCLFRPDNSAHWVKVIAVKNVGGRFQVTYVEDGKQAAAGGQRRVNVNLSNTDGDGMVEFAGTNIEIRKAVSESPVLKVAPVKADAGSPAVTYVFLLGCAVLALVRRMGGVTSRGLGGLT